MKDYIKAGFGVTIGYALAEFTVQLVSKIVERMANGSAKNENEETKSEEKSEE